MEKWRDWQKLGLELGPRPQNQLLTAKEYCIFIAAIDPVNKRVSLSSSCK